MQVEEEDLFKDLENVSKRGNESKSSVHKLFGGLLISTHPTEKAGEPKGKLHKLSVDKESLFNYPGIKCKMVSETKNNLHELFVEAEPLFSSPEIISTTDSKSKRNLYKLLNSFIERDCLFNPLRILYKILSESMNEVHELFGVLLIGPIHLSLADHPSKNKLQKLFVVEEGTFNGIEEGPTPLEIMSKTIRKSDSNDLEEVEVEQIRSNEQSKVPGERPETYILK